jgi:hypothetical protein
MMRPVNDEEVLHELDRRMAGHGNGERAARELGVEPRRLREMKSGGRAISLKVGRGLGFELRWVRVKE